MTQRQWRSDDTDLWLEGWGDGSDGELAISSNTTEAPIDASCTGTAASNTLSATNASFAPGQLILIHKSRGNTTVSAGQWELNKITAYTAGTITTKYPLIYSYNDSGADQSQVRVLKQYSSVTINTGVTYSAKAWDGNVGGILAFFCVGKTDIVGTLSASGKGYRAGACVHAGQANAAEGQAGDVAGHSYANGVGGGGGAGTAGLGAGGGGGNSTAGGVGAGSSPGAASNTAGSASLVNATFGGGGGGSSTQLGSQTGSMVSGPGAGWIAVWAKNLVVSGAITSNGQQASGIAGESSTVRTMTGAGGGGGNNLLNCETGTLGSGLITANGAAQLAAGGAQPLPGGAGGNGYNHLNYRDSFTGTTSPTLDSRQDSTLHDYIAGGSFLYNFI